ncbi:MAG: chemotaxis protein CheW [Nitrospiraceae bacterium]|nr:chemotaxis protein CheW [Nitrospiraceae bacterium]
MSDKYIIFRAGRELFGIGIGQVVEILDSIKVNRLPEMPGYIAGVITLRGAVIPVMDMRKRFGIAPEPQKERIIIVKNGRERVGLIVDEVFEIKGFSEKEIFPPPAVFKGLHMEYLKGLAKTKNEVAILLDMGRVLASEEKLLLIAGEGDA